MAEVVLIGPNHDPATVKAALAAAEDLPEVRLEKGTSEPCRTVNVAARRFRLCLLPFHAPVYPHRWGSWHDPAELAPAEAE